MKFFLRLINKVTEVFFTLLFLIKNGKKVSFCKNVRFHKNTDLIIDDGCRLKIGENFFARKNFTIRVTCEADRTGGGAYV